jgi:hypothetical protein
VLQTTVVKSRLEYSTNGKHLKSAGVEERVEAPSFPFPVHHVRWEDSCNNLSYVRRVFMVTKNNVNTLAPASGRVSLNTFDVSTLPMAHDPPFSGTNGTYVEVIVTYARRPQPLNHARVAGN